jgi:Ca-activated chloride channel family protein
MSALLTRLTGYTLANPGWLWLLALLPLGLWLRARRGTSAVPLGAAALLIEEGLPHTLRQRLLWLPRTLQVTGLCLLIVALARPVERVEEPRETEGIDLLLVLDLSSSMTANDLDPGRTRLEVAKEAAARFIRMRPDDRVGLVTFARFPDVRCPLTLDHEALLEILASVQLVTSDGPEDATGIGAAVAHAARVLESSGARSRVVVLLTDGEENVALAGKPRAIAPVHAAQLCEQLGVRVYSIAAGVGRRDPSGAMIRLDTRAVRALAQRTGGTFHAAVDAANLSAIYERIDALERAPTPDPEFRTEDRHQGFLIAGLLLLVLGGVLRTTWLEVLP